VVQRQDEDKHGIIKLLIGKSVCRKGPTTLKQKEFRIAKVKEHKVWEVETGLYTRNWLFDEQTLHEIRHLKRLQFIPNGELSKEERSIESPSGLSYRFR